MSDDGTRQVHNITGSGEPHEVWVMWWATTHHMYSDTPDTFSLWHLLREDGRTGCGRVPAGLVLDSPRPLLDRSGVCGRCSRQRGS